LESYWDVIYIGVNKYIYKQSNEDGFSVQEYLQSDIQRQKAEDFALRIGPANPEIAQTFLVLSPYVPGLLKTTSSAEKDKISMCRCPNKLLLVIKS
jgi:hypothetical protein